MEVWLNAFLFSALDGNEYATSGSDVFIPRE